ncbi:unnamed protein product [Paramecium sonneborni]|uniref:DNA-directed RNA polymerase subunit n=1 Tax=Paramecium sonneborni TaxID=65129 RepID=A0A8S1N166_9CILI|nr:unnamed protein product [Paramecium sonneborni]
MRQSGADFTYSTAPIAKVRRVEFGLMSHELIKEWTGEIEIKEIQTNELDGTPKQNGLNDLRMGVNTNAQKCKTCGETKYCQGHFGRIELNKPVYHVGFLQIVKKVLKCICHNCGKLRQPQTEDANQQFQRAKEHKLNRKRLNEIVKLLGRIDKCEAKLKLEENQGNEDCCQAQIPTRIQALNGQIKIQYSTKEAAKELTAERCLDIFKKIRNEDAIILGFTKESRPQDLIIKYLLVMPPQVRPAIEMNPARIAQDQYTQIYKSILQKNIEIANCSSDAERVRLAPELMREVAKIIDSEKAGKIKMKSTQPLKSIRARLKGKEGRFRQNLMGKRVDFCARSVISPDANLGMDELGVPQIVADQLTIPEEVTEYNLERVIQLAKTNKIKYVIVPITDPRSKQRKFQALYFDFTDTEEQIRQKINQGVIVERCLQDGDFVLFNRQPTLHRMSMMGHRVRILPYSTFRLNLSVCTPYNADFDGDEMNMHVPQSYETIAELKYLAHVPRQIVTPKSNQPVMGIVQDSLLGCCLFTQRDTFLTRDQVMHLMMWNEQFTGELPMPAILKPQELWSGKQIMSMIIPQSINTERGIREDDLKKPNWNADDKSLCIQRGNLVSGIFNKELVGQGAGSVVHLCWLDLGAEKTLEFMTSCQRIVNNWLIMHSFTVGCQDIAPHINLVAETEKRSREQDEEYIKLLQIFLDAKKIQDNRYHQKGKRIMDSFEYSFNMKLNKVRDDINSKVTETIDQIRNCMYKMIWAKSKGEASNLAQITSLVGQQNLESKRIQFGFAYRTLPHFSKFDYGPEARGFVASNFFKGLKPTEFFFHTMGGRDGLIDTAVKTSRTGYIQRKLIKAVEDVFVRYDSSCRDSVGAVYQFHYGEDKMAAEFIEHQEIKCVNLSNQQLAEKYQLIQEQWFGSEIRMRYQNIFTEDVIDDIETDYDGQALLKGEFDEIKKIRDELRRLFLIDSAPKEEIFTHYYLVVNIERIISTIKINKKISDREKCRLNPITVTKEVDELIQKVDKLLSYDLDERRDCINLFRTHLKVSLASKDLCCRHRLTPEAFQELISEIIYKLKKSMAHPGEAVGAIAAQSLGEPTTQMTLNTFHKSGVTGDKNVTLGVPRLQELLDASKKTKTPSLTIYFDPPLEYAELELKDDKDKKSYLKTEQLAHPHKQDDFTQSMLVQMQGRILGQTFGQYIIKSEIYYQSDPNNPLHITEDQEDNFTDGIFDTDEAKYKWILFLHMDHQKILSNLETWDKIRDSIPKILDETEKKFGISSQNTIVDPDSMNHKYIQIKYYHDYNDQKKFKPERGKGNFDDEIEFDEEAKTKTYVDTPYTILKRLEETIRGHSLGGISKITRILHSQIEKQFYINNKTGGFLKQANIEGKGKWKIVEKYLETEGTNLKEILRLEHVDQRRTTTDDVYEISQVLGIEAARAALVGETRKIFNHYGIYINYRHLYLLYDWMTHRGRLTAVNRNGINRIPEVSVLRKSSFEETVEILYDAAVFSEVDHMRGLSENIIFGQLCPHGTGSFELMVNAKNVKEFKLKSSHADKFTQGGEYLVEPSPNTQNEHTPIYPNTPGPGLLYMDSPYTPYPPKQSPGVFATPMNIHTPDQYSHRSPYYTNTPLIPYDTYQLSPVESISGQQPQPGKQPNVSGSHSPGSPHYTSHTNSPSPSYRSSERATSGQRSSSPILNSSRSPNYTSSIYNSPLSPTNTGSGRVQTGSPHSPQGSNFTTFSPVYQPQGNTTNQYEQEQ